MTLEEWEASRKKGPAGPASQAQAGAELLLSLCPGNEAC